MREITEEDFLKDVANHVMKVVKDDGVHRHLRFANSDPKYSFNQWFEIVTWPGFLAYSGDMGCFVFSRLRDMFEFFRTRPSGDPSKLHINLGYWSEKLQAVDRDGRSSSVERFSSEKFTRVVTEHFKEWAEDEGLSDEQRKQFEEQLDDQVLRYVDDGEHEARKALSDFSEEIDGVQCEFQDTWEWNFDEYTVRFVWCCYALAWAIRKYDAAHVTTDQAQVA